MFKPLKMPQEAAPKKKIMTQQNMLIALVPLGIAWLGYRTELVKNHADNEQVAQEKIWYKDSSYKNLSTKRWEAQYSHNHFSDSLAMENARKLDLILSEKK